MQSGQERRDWLADGDTAAQGTIGKKGGTGDSEMTGHGGPTLSQEEGQGAQRKPNLNPLAGFPPTKASTFKS